MAVKEETLALAIPNDLKGDHPDSDLVVKGLAIAIAAAENSDALTARGRMMDVHAALASQFVPIFKAHLVKEDEDWNALKAKADKYRPTVSLEWRRLEGSGDASFTYKGAVSGRGAVFLTYDDASGLNKYFARLSGELNTDEFIGDTPRKAVDAAFASGGFTVENVTYVKPLPSPEPIDYSMTEEDRIRTVGAMPTIEQQIASRK